MEAETNPPLTATLEEASLVRGGPFYRAQQTVRLIHSDHWNFGRRIIFVLTVGWLPLFLITALLNPGGLGSLVREYRVHARMLAAVPVLLLGELLMELRFRAVLSHIRQSGILGASDLTYMDDLLASMLRVRDSLVPELLILLLIIVRTATAYKGLVDVTPWLSYAAGSDIRLTAAGWYAVVVTAPIFQLLLGLGLWKWLLWTFFAFKLSGRNLKLVPTHPDQHGGLGFLGLSAAAFAPIAFAANVVIGATWRHDMLYRGAHLLDFRLPAIVLIAIIALVALGPLIFFVPRLAALRRKGILEYGILGQMHSADFHRKWILQRVGHESEFLQAIETSTLADFARTYDNIRQLKPFPADRAALIALAIAVAVPALPVVLTQIPLAVVLKGLLAAAR
jgi:hypothetical protein